jgi:hypothetical protein
MSRAGAADAGARPRALIGAVFMIRGRFSGLKNDSEHP